MQPTPFLDVKKLGGAFLIFLVLVASFEGFMGINVTTQLGGFFTFSNFMMLAVGTIVIRAVWMAVEGSGTYKNNLLLALGAVVVFALVADGVRSIGHRLSGVGARAGVATASEGPRGIQPRSNAVPSMSRSVGENFNIPSSQTLLGIQAEQQRWERYRHCVDNCSSGNMYMEGAIENAQRCRANCPQY